MPASAPAYPPPVPLCRLPDHNIVILTVPLLLHNYYPVFYDIICNQDIHMFTLQQIQHLLIRMRILRPAEPPVIMGYNHCLRINLPKDFPVHIMPASMVGHFQIIGGYRLAFPYQPLKYFFTCIPGKEYRRLTAKLHPQYCADIMGAFYIILINFPHATHFPRKIPVHNYIRHDTTPYPRTASLSARIS